MTTGHDRFQTGTSRTRYNVHCIMEVMYTSHWPVFPATCLCNTVVLKSAWQSRSGLGSEALTYVRRYNLPFLCYVSLLRDDFLFASGVLEIASAGISIQADKGVDHASGRRGNLAFCPFCQVSLGSAGTFAFKLATSSKCCAVCCAVSSAHHFS